MIPTQFFTKVEHGEGGEDGQGDDFLQDFQLGGGIDAVAPAVGRNHEEIFEEGDPPTGEDHNEEGRFFEF